MQMACDSGESISCIGLGLLYRSSRYGFQPLVLKKSFEIMKRGCDNDFIYLCYHLGKLYEEGRGTKQDYAKALEIYE